jgi:hypothetical protein
VELLKNNPNLRKKECTICKILFDNEFFYKNKDDTRFDDCIKCYKEKHSKDSIKQCNSCLEILSLSDFQKDESHSDGVRSACKKCRNSQIRERRKKLGKIECEFCKLVVEKRSLTLHQTSKSCLEKQGVEVDRKRKTPLVNCRSKTVEQLDIKTQKVLNTFNSIAEAVLKTCIGRTNIRSCCIGKNKTAGGYKWRYANISN